MRLALVVPAFPKLSETFVVRKVVDLLARGVDVHVVCARSESVQWRHFPALAAVPDMCRRVHVTLPARSSLRAVLQWSTALAVQTARTPDRFCTYLSRARRRVGGWRGAMVNWSADAPLVRLRPDVVHFVFGALALGRTRRIRELDARVSVSFRGYDLSHFRLDEPHVYDELWDDVDAIHVLGTALERLVRERGCPDGVPIVRIPPAVDTNAFDPAGRPHTEAAGTPVRPLRVLSVGRLEWVKGYPYGLLAVAALRKRGVHVHYRIVGEGAALEEVAFARHQLGLADVVELAGARPPDAIKRELAAADVLLHPAVAEGFGNAPLEAQAMRLPVVATDALGLPECVAHDETGFVVPRRQPAALADALHWLCDPAERERLGRAGRVRVARHFSVRSQADAWATFFQDVVGTHAARGSPARRPP